MLQRQNTSLCNHGTIINTVSMIHTAQSGATIFAHAPHHFLQSFIATNTTDEQDSV
jgi:hypothetical protein